MTVEFIYSYHSLDPDTGYDPALQGEVIELVQAQYALVRQERCGTSPPKKPKPAGSAASGDAQEQGSADEKQAKGILALSFL